MRRLESVFVAPLAVACSLALCASCVFDSDRRPLVDASVTARSAYVFRGQTFTERPVVHVDSAMQLPAKGEGTVTVAGFGNLELSDSIGEAWGAEGHRGELTQMDLWVGYSKRIGATEVTLGARHYSWPTGEAFRFAPFPSTSEVALRVGGEVAGLGAALTAHWDIDAAGSLYARADLSRSVALSERTTLEVAAWLGWSDAEHSDWLYRTRKNALADVGVSVDVRYDLDDVTSARVGVLGSTIVDDALRDWFAPRIDADVVVASLGVAWAF
jgi:hypothetical protein